MPEKEDGAVGALAGLRMGIVAVSLGQGGAERQAALWTTAAQALGAEVSVLAVEATATTYAVAPGTRVEVVGKAGFADTRRVLGRVRRFAERCDVIAAFQPYCGLLCAVAGIRTPWLIVAGQDPRQLRDTGRFPLGVYRWAFRRCWGATAPNEALVDLHASLRLVSRGGWRVVPNIVSEEAFTRAQGPRAGALLVGRLVPEKQPLLALRAAAKAGVPLSVLGDGPERDALLAEAERLGVADRLSLLGFTAEPWSVYARHRVLVLTSRYETFANVIVESLAAGTPVVSVDCDFGPRGILGAARWSHLVPIDEDAVAAALARVAATSPSPEEDEECAQIAGCYRSAALEPLIAEALLGAVHARRAAG
ncbi:MAG: glycosyltransferase [Actinomycetota bacterium]|nr:glycosyltransferase [Actinomycetota bacterium]